MKVILLWRTDPWFSTNSKELIGVFNEWIETSYQLLTNMTSHYLFKVMTSCFDEHLL